MSKKNLVNGLLFIIIAASVGLNIYLLIKNDRINEKVNAFIPAAMTLEEENRRLQEVEKQQQQQLEDCASYKDSLRTVTPVVPQTLLPTQDPSQQLPAQQPPNNAGDRTLRDLNKGIQ